MPKVKVKQEKEKFILTDENNYIYGTYKIKKDADQACKDWNNYYADPN